MAGKLFRPEFDLRLRSYESSRTALWNNLERCFQLNPDKSAHQYAFPVDKLLDGKAFMRLSGTRGVGMAVLACFNSLQDSLRKNPDVTDYSRQLSFEGLQVFCKTESDTGYGWRAFRNSTSADPLELDHLEAFVADLKNRKVKSNYVTALEHWLEHLRRVA